MRICLHTVREVGPNFIGGTERLLIETAKELAALGHEPFIVSTGLRGEIEIEGIPLIQKTPEPYAKRYLAYGFANSAFITSEIMGGMTLDSGLRALGSYVDAQLKGVRADIIHLNSFATSIYSMSASGAVVSNHENEQEYDRKWGEGFTSRLAEIVLSGAGELQHASLLTTPSRYYAEYYSDAFGLPVVAIKGGISLTTFDRLRRKHREELSRSSSALQVLLPARFEPFQKGHDVAMRACRILMDQDVSLNLVFSGMREDYEERLGDFLNAARSFGVADCVTAKRFEDIHTAYLACDVVISPERYCSYGLAISEALALGVPTVLSDIPTYREIADGYEHARFFRCEDAAGLAAKIIEASRIPRKITDREAIRFRIANDLRATALQLHTHYIEISQNNSDA